LEEIKKLAVLCVRRPYVCVYDDSSSSPRVIYPVYTIKQTSSRRRAIARVFWIHFARRLLDVCLIGRNGGALLYKLLHWRSYALLRAPSS